MPDSTNTLLSLYISKGSEIEGKILSSEIDVVSGGYEVTQKFSPSWVSSKGKGIPSVIKYIKLK